MIGMSMGMGMDVSMGRTLMNTQGTQIDPQ